MNEEGRRDIKIPIRAIVEQAMKNNGASYEEYEFNALRRYFIACLNLGFLEPKDLVPMVNKFAQKIKLISTSYNSINKMDYYMISENVLYINGDLKDKNDTFYDVNFFKAVTETIFNANDKHIGISNALCNMAAEKIYNMDDSGSRIIMPKTDAEMIGKKKIEIRAGYMNYNLIISLTKQLFMCLGLNENIIIKRMYFEGFDEVFNDIFTSKNMLLLVSVLDKLCILYINRKVKGIINPSEYELINKYQIMINDSFETINQNYFAFCALITNDDLRKKCMEKLKNIE